MRRATFQLAMVIAAAGLLGSCTLNGQGTPSPPASTQPPNATVDLTIDGGTLTAPAHLVAAICTFDPEAGGWAITVPLPFPSPNRARAVRTLNLLLVSNQAVVQDRYGETFWTSGPTPIPTSQTGQMDVILSPASGVQNGLTVSGSWSCPANLAPPGTVAPAS
ncbi:MAG TPA: hypothetical protein VG015_04935 [Candidatus Dormibacteraeota bacterium]|jgi:hypothetical protein|nr:hypothetical protein [Candidatus Dormibacteraeota bacterium]